MINFGLVKNELQSFFNTRHWTNLKNLERSPPNAAKDKHIINIFLQKHNNEISLNIIF